MLIRCILFSINKKKKATAVLVTFKPQKNTVNFFSAAEIQIFSVFPSISQITMKTSILACRKKSIIRQ